MLSMDDPQTIILEFKRQVEYVMGIHSHHMTKMDNTLPKNWFKIFKNCGPNDTYETPRPIYCRKYDTLVPQLNIMEVEDSNEKFEGNEKENEDLDTK